MNMANKLAKEKSLYLRQHAENPVNWWPWCKEALEVAQKDKKLLLVSIGYASCHWCHVMENECFSNEFIAKIMNDNFVCIKVDREERPDLDQFYMEAVQMITQRGGWPLNVFCLPSGEPFFGGTYFPAEDRGQGIVPWPQLLIRIADHYKRKPEEFFENSANIIKNLFITNNPDSGEIGAQDHLKFVLGLLSTYDQEWGGFGGAPKFPPNMILDYFLSMRSSRYCENNKDFAKQIDDAIEGTLVAMGHGGIYDQIGGGYMRYSVDRYWLIPHFEKMLYDNGLLISINSKAFLRSRNLLLKKVVEETIDWMESEMKLFDHDGPYVSSIDADSEEGEGTYYAWTRKEVIAVLGEADGSKFCDAYNVEAEGNFEKDKSVLALVYDDINIRDALKPMREKLLEVRLERKKPRRDDKVIVGWNALVIKGLCEAGFNLGEKAWMKRGMEVGDWIWENMYVEGKLRRIYEREEEGFLDDYAFMIDAYLALAGKGEWTVNGAYEKYLTRAVTLMDRVMEKFRDTQMPGYYYSSEDFESGCMRKKIWWDEAIPSGNGVLVNCFALLYVFTGDSRYKEEMEALRKGFGGIAHRGANGVASALAGYLRDDVGIAVMKWSGDMDAMRDAFTSQAYRDLNLICGDNTLCKGPQCVARISDIESVLKML